MTDLKLIAFDGDDLSVLSAHMQDAVVRIADMAYLPRERRFAMIANRFDWEGVMSEAHRTTSAFERRRTALRFDRVKAAKVQSLDLKAKDQVLALLAVAFEAVGEDDPAGAVVLTFAGGGRIRLEVECLEAEMKDLGGAWAAKSKPQHSDR
jgi:hypothetical protein